MSTKIEALKFEISLIKKQLAKIKESGKTDQETCNLYHDYMAAKADLEDQLETIIIYNTIQYNTINK